MTTLQSIGFNVAAAAGLGTVALLCFGWAVKARTQLIAPRCAARSLNVIYHDASANHGKPPHPSQDRGNPWTGWIGWTLNFSYEDILRGIPGTGTRRGGLDGVPLRGNLDAIVLLRFHALGLKVSMLATVLFLLILLPMYYTSKCHELGKDDSNWSDACGANTYNLTNYERTTIANVPSNLDDESLETQNSESTIRLYFCVVIYWIVQAYLLYLLKREWVEILAMRRVYYLEADVWGDRKREQEAIAPFVGEKGVGIVSPRMSSHEQEKLKQDESQAKETGMMEIHDTTTDDEVRLTVRPPWIPHPEHSDTVPNVQLYSVLVGGLPSLPEQEEGEHKMGSMQHRRKTMDWQIAITSAFFDHCVPNQPGYSSSVAAVTILPSSKSIASAWRKWYAAASKLRRLRFIRAQIAQKYAEDVLLVIDDTNDQNNNQKELVIDVEDSENMFESVQEPSDHDVEKGDSLQEASDASGSLVASPTGSKRQRMRSMRSTRRVRGESESSFQSAQQYKEYYEQMLKGQEHDVVVPTAALVPDETENGEAYTEEEIQALLSNRFGPEQTAIYSREFAQSAAPCCPNGCREEAVMKKSLEELQEMEKAAELDVLQANHDLYIEQQKAKQLRTLQAEEGEQDIVVNDGSSAPDALDIESSGEGSSDTRPISNQTNLRERKKAHRATGDGDFEMENKIFQQNATETNKKTHRRNDSGLVMNPLSSDNASERKLSKWDKVRSIASITMKELGGKGRRPAPSGVITGRWTWPSLTELCGKTKETAQGTTEYLASQTKELMDLSLESQYAVVTFTSRQAAVAARQCLADGRVNGRWKIVEELPIAPIADAAACDICACRNCCRPVTLTISDKQKNQRMILVLICLAAFYILTPVVLSLITSLLNPDSLEQTMPKLFRWLEKNFGGGVAQTIAGFLQSCLYTIFFASCPTIFKSLSNFGSGSNSLANAELKAMQYFFWYMILSAFAGTLIANMILFGLAEGNVSGQLQTVLLSIARAIPSTVAVTWLNWLVLRAFFVMTAQYLLQMPVFLYTMIGWSCMSRLSRGGGPGPPVPYRIYIDSGMAMISLLALAPSSPLVAPACLLYFLWCQPVLRRSIIFVYRPRFDGGGFRWPFLFMMTISALLVGQIILVATMALKQAPGPAILAALPILVTLWVYRSLRQTFTRPFNDSALLQTSLLDGWDSARETTVERREEFRQFLVDSHKASYIPVCLAGSDNKDASLTAEPAVVVPLEKDILKGSLQSEKSSVSLVSSEPSVQRESSSTSVLDQSTEKSGQYGAVLRRAVTTMQALKAFSAASGSDQPMLESLTEEPSNLGGDDGEADNSYFAD